MTRKQMVDIIVRQLAMAGDPGARQEVEQMPDEQIASIAAAILSTVHPDMRAALTEDPDAFTAAEITGAARRYGGAGTGGRFGTTLLGQGGPPTETPTAPPVGTPTPTPPPAPPLLPPYPTVNPNQPRTGPYGNLGPAFADLPREPAPPVSSSFATEREAAFRLPEPPPPPGQTPAERLFQSKQYLADLYGQVALGQRRDLLGPLQAEFLRVQAGIGLDPNTVEGQDWEKFVGNYEKQIDNLRQSLPTQRAGEGTGWAQLALQERIFEYNQTEDVRKRQDVLADQLSRARGGVIDPTTGEFVQFPEERRLAAEAASARAANTGRYIDEGGREISTLEREKFETGREDTERARIAQMAQEFSSHAMRLYGDLAMQRAQAERNALAAAPYYIPPGMEYAPGDEPGGLRARSYAALGLSFNPLTEAQRISWNDPRVAYNEERQRQLDALLQYPGNPAGNPISNYFRIE